MNLLLIDDDKHVVGPLRNTIEHHFQRQGIRLFHCDNVKDGLELAKSDRTIKLILLDVLMPCVADNPLGTIPFIPKFPCAVAIYSAHTDETLIKAATDRGAVAYISKLDRADEQLARIDDLLGSITSARVRMKTEETEGYRMLHRTWDRKLAAVVASIAILSATGGAFGMAFAYGARRQAERDEVADLKKRVTSIEANSRMLRRMERNIDKLLFKNGIEPTRDDE